MNKHSQAPEEFQLESFLPYQLSLLSNLVSEGIARTYRKPFGLSVTEWRVIAVLGRFPGLTASEIMSHTAMDKVAISRAVKRLHERRLVERKEHREDRRRAHLALTRDMGKQLFEQVVPRALAYESQLLSALDEKDRKELDRLITRLHDAAVALNGDGA